MMLDTCNMDIQILRIMIKGPNPLLGRKLAVLGTLPSAHNPKRSDCILNLS